MEYKSELFHHGTKGMKWGQRRYQNEDGTLTAAGKNRYRTERAKRIGEAKARAEKARNDPRNMSDEELSSRVKRMTMEKTYSKLSKDRGGPAKVEKAKKVADASSKLVDEIDKLERETRPAPTKSRMNLSKMTDQQLRERINREHLERQYNDLFNPDAAPTVSKGRKVAQGIIEVAGTAIALTGGALGIAVAIKELRG